eukprot:5957529-Prymnesium_polylepis.1
MSTTPCRVRSRTHPALAPALARSHGVPPIQLVYRSASASACPGDRCKAFADARHAPIRRQH